MSDARRQPTTTKATLIIPALNEAQVIADLVRRTPREAVDEIIVVDNGSTDGTGQVARAAGARVVTEMRRGYGSACWAGVSSLDGSAQIVVFFDGDGSQRPEELPRVIEPVVAGRADLVLGARSASDAHPLHATFGTRLVAAFVARRYGLTITDIPPFRAIRVDRKSTRLNSSHVAISYAVFCLKKKNNHLDHPHLNKQNKQTTQ